MVVAAGELDIASVDELEGALSDSKTRGTITLDARGLTFIDAVGLGCLIRLKERLAGEGRRLVIAGPSPQFLRLLELSDSAGVLEIGPVPDH